MLHTILKQLMASGACFGIMLQDKNPETKDTFQNARKIFLHYQILQKQNIKHHNTANNVNYKYQALLRLIRGSPLTECSRLQETSPCDFMATSSTVNTCVITGRKRLLLLHSLDRGH